MKRYKPRSTPGTQKKRKLEKSAIFISICLCIGILCIALYYVAIFMELDCDPSVATTAMTVIIASIMSYCMYNFGLKNSRNKYGVDENGEPYCTKQDYSDDNYSSDDESDSVG